MNLVAKLRLARQMIRAGYTQKDIIRETGLTSVDIAGQRRLMALVKGPHRMQAADLQTRSGPKARSSKGRAEVSGDLCDIFAAPPSRRDLSLAYASED